MRYKLPQLLKVVVLYSFLFLTFGALLEATHPTIQKASSAPVSTVVTVSEEKIPSLPQKLSIPRLGIKLLVGSGEYDPSNRTWTLSDTTLHFAGMTSLPNGRSGNTLIYGHNTNEVLAPTDRLVEGDTARLTTLDGRTFVYTFKSGRLVDPTDTSILEQTDSRPRLTLLTCEGIWDEKRRLMEFDFVSVN